MIKEAAFVGLLRQIKKVCTNSLFSEIQGKTNTLQRELINLALFNQSLPQLSIPRLYIRPYCTVKNALLCPTDVIYRSFPVTEYFAPHGHKLLLL